MYSMTVSYTLLAENERTGEWEPSDRRSYTVYGSTVENVKLFAEQEYDQLRRWFDPLDLDMDDFCDRIDEVPEDEAYLYEDGDLEER